MCNGRCSDGFGVHRIQLFKIASDRNAEGTPHTARCGSEQEETEGTKNCPPLTPLPPVRKIVHPWLNGFPTASGDFSSDVDSGLGLCLSGAGLLPIGMTFADAGLTLATSG